MTNSLNTFLTWTCVQTEMLWIPVSGSYITPQGWFNQSHRCFSEIQYWGSATYVMAWLRKCECVVDSQKWTGAAGLSPCLQWWCRKAGPPYWTWTYFCQHKKHINMFAPFVVWICIGSNVFRQNPEMCVNVYINNMASSENTGIMTEAVASMPCLNMFTKTIISKIHFVISAVGLYTNVGFHIVWV